MRVTQREATSQPGGFSPGLACVLHYGPARAADPDAVTALLTAVAGFFVRASTQPPPPKLERVRAFQRAQGEAGLAWLRRRIS